MSEHVHAGEGDTGPLKMRSTIIFGLKLDSRMGDTSASDSATITDGHRKINYFQIKVYSVVGCLDFVSQTKFEKSE